MAKCICDYGWHGTDCSIPICQDINNCSSNGQCVDVNKCSCNSGWLGLSCNQFVCTNNCSGHGTCVGPNQCRCENKWSGALCNFPVCQENCNNNGRCIDVDRCSCSSGYTGAFCDSFLCDYVQNCSNHGSCIGANKCQCKNGWMGILCNQPTCDTINFCSNHGLCVLENTCECFSGWKSNDCSLFECKPNCSNGGTCIGSNKCSCPEEWEGQFCTIPICKNNCFNRGTCVAPNVCKCYPQYAGYNCLSCSNNTWGNNCNLCPICKHGKCNLNDGTCTCDSINWTGNLCDQCADKFYGINCLPLPKVVSLIPSYSSDAGNTSITILAYNLNESLNYKCLFDSIEVNASIFFSNGSDFRLSCLSPKMEPKTVTLKLKYENEFLNYDGAFRVIGTCPQSGCGENEPIKRGVCFLGKCQCILTFDGDDCKSILIPPKFYPIENIYIDQFDSISLSVQLLAGSEPTQITLFEGPDVIKIVNSTLIWSSIDTNQVNNTIILKAQNKVGYDYVTFNINVILKYIIFINSISQSFFESPQAVIITGSLRFKSNATIIFKRSCSVNVKIKRSYFNDQLTIRLNSRSDGSVFFRYMPSANEFGSYSLDAKNYLDTSEFQPQLNWFYLGKS